MKFTGKHIIPFIAFLAMVFFAGCAREEMPDNREKDYGYVQFRLYKEASFPTRSGNIEYLRDVAKIKVNLEFEGTTFSQTLVINPLDDVQAEYGLRTEKLKLLAGDYTLLSYVLCDKMDEDIEEYIPEGGMSGFSVTVGGLTTHRLSADVTPRGQVRFTLVKDFSDFTDTPQTRAPSREYTFDEIRKVTVEVENTVTHIRETFEKLPVSFEVEFSEEKGKEDYQVSKIVCDTVLSIKAGEYAVSSYVVYDENRSLLETNAKLSGKTFSVEDNDLTEADVPVRLYESDEYIKDYYALYEIWKALDGEHWYYCGEDYPKGSNWDFNKDPDLWGNQPGIGLHANGRVARMNLSDFGFRGDMPEDLGQLTEIIELYLGTHNDMNLHDFVPEESALDFSVADRIAVHKRYLKSLHPSIPLSEPIARALAEHDVRIPEIEIYDSHKEKEVIDAASGQLKSIGKKDLIAGKLCNGLTSLPASIGNLKKLERLYIANGKLTTLPAEFSELKSCTDLELYNCPEMRDFPTSVAMMPSLISVNLSNNPQWTSSVADKAIQMLSEGKSKESIQILYMTENKIKTLPASMKNMKKLGLLDLSFNQIETIEEPFGKGVSLIQAFFSHNKISAFPKDKDGCFCGTDDMEVFSADFNELTKVPDIFDAGSMFTIGSISFSYNHIDGFENEDSGYRGMNVETFTLTNNPELKVYPKCLATSGSKISNLNFRGCSLSKIPEGSFVGEGVINISSIDLSYNHLSDFPAEMHAGNLPYLYGIDISYNRFSKLPFEPLDSRGFTVYAIRGQRNAQGARILEEWPDGLSNYPYLRAFYIGSNNIQVVKDKISPELYFLDISDNPEIIFDATDICNMYKHGYFILLYDKTQNIRGCEEMFN